jgi:hypothetical protein
LRIKRGLTTLARFFGFYGPIAQRLEQRTQIWVAGREICQ